MNSVLRVLISMLWDTISNMGSISEPYPSIILVQLESH